LTAKEAGAAVRQGVTAVLDLTSEFSESAPFRSLAYRNIPVLDLTAPTFEQLEEMAAFVEEESSKGVVYVHCKIGYSRTGAAAAAFLLRTGKVRTVAEAIYFLSRVRPGIVIRPEAMTALDEFATRLTLSPRLQEALLQ
jgi:protein-tyrosine phosphatase